LRSSGFCAGTHSLSSKCRTPTDTHALTPYSWSIHTFYQTFYSRAGDTAIPPFADLNPHNPATQLNRPITGEEVTQAVRLLSNGRAAGCDDMSGELYKHTTPSIHHLMAAMYNTVFAKRQSVPVLLDGTLIVLNKPGKIPTIDNTRPITLLTTTRKVLSTVVLRRIFPCIDNYLSPGQSGFRRGRSTTDVLGHTDGSQQSVHDRTRTSASWASTCLRRLIRYTG
jgi:hypothetical protein